MDDIAMLAAVGEMALDLRTTKAVANRNRRAALAFGDLFIACNKRRRHHEAMADVWSGAFAATCIGRAIFDAARLKRPDPDRNFAGWIRSAIR